MTASKKEYIIITNTERRKYRVTTMGKKSTLMKIHAKTSRKHPSKVIKHIQESPSNTTLNMNH